MRSPSTLGRSLEETDRIVTIERDSPPRVLFSGEDLLVEDLPVGTRVIYPRPPIAGLPNPRSAIRWALNHPEGCDPLHAQLRPGMKVTIAIDDISLPLPPMRTPDVRQEVLEIVLELLSDSGVDDVHLVVAIALHRRMTEAEIRRMVGPKVFEAFWPDRLYNHDAEDLDGLVVLGTTDHGEKVILNRRAAESDLVVYVNLNLVPMDGGHKSLGTGLTSYEGVKAHHEPRTIRESRSYMDPPRSALHRSVDRIGRLIDQHVNVFHVETTINNRMFDGPLDFLMKREEDFVEMDRLKLEGMRAALRRLPRAAKRRMFQAVPAAYDVIAVHAGRTEPTHRKILETSFRQYLVDVDFQADVLVYGIPYISPYNVNSILNPLLVQVMACGYFFNFYRGRPLVKAGGTLIVTHPCSDEFDPEHHPSYIEFFHRLLPETRDALVLEQKYEREFAENPAYVHMYRTGHAYHGSHPFFMWYWGENGRQHLGRIIAVGADNEHVPRLMGWESAATLSEAIDMARSTHGRGAEIAMLHHPPIVMTQNLG
jgi:lactate racemase